MKRKLLSLICIAALLVSSVLFAGCSGEADYREVKEKTESYLVENLTEPGYGDEWKVLGLARAEAETTDGFYDTYLANVQDAVSQAKGELSARKYTEYSRVVLALTAIGADPADVAGYNLLEKLADFEAVTSQGINGAIWALIALDSGDYAIPQVSDVKTQTTRELLVQEIISQEISSGGFGLTGTEADVDLTAMAIQALAPYAENDEKAASVVNRSIDVLADMQDEDGFFRAYGDISSESLSQVITALTAVGIDPDTDARFVKGEVSVVDALLTFANEEGGFCHTYASEADEKETDAIATEQGYYALVAYDRYLNGQSSLYDMK